MTTLFRLTFGLVVALIMSVTAAFADHMTGSYVGTGDAVGTNLVVQQSGTTVTGELSGTTVGFLQGTSDGGDNVSGMIELQGNGRFQFQATYGADSLTITLYGNNAQETHVFNRAGSETVAPAPATDKYYYLDGTTQIGPVTRDEIIAGIGAGQVTRDTLVWVAGQTEWTPAEAHAELADVLPPALPAATAYYVAENGEQVGPLTAEEVIAKIDAGAIAGTDLAWTNGMDAWAALSSFGEFETALAVPPPVPAEETESDGPPPLPADEAAGDTPPALPEETTAGGPPPMEPAAHDAAEADPLLEQVTAMMEAQLGHFSEAQRDGFLACSMAAFEPLSAEDRVLLAEAGFQLDREQQIAFDARNPGVIAAAEACVAQ